MLKIKNITIIVIILMSIALLYICFIFTIASPIVIYANLKNDTNDTIKVYSTQTKEEFVIAPGSENKFLHDVGDIIVTDLSGKNPKHFDISYGYSKMPREFIIYKNHIINVSRTVKYILESDMELYVLSPGLNTPDKSNQPEGYPKKGRLGTGT